MSVFLLLRMIYAACLIVTTIVGLRLGGRSERVGAIIVLTASLTTMVIERSLPFAWRGQRLGLIVVDVAVLVAFFYLALKSRRFWPLWATAFHLIALCSHGVVLLEPSRTLQAYIFFQGFWAYPIMLLIVSGALSHQHRLRAAKTSMATGPSNPRSINSKARYMD